jgi:hypothetical protein
VNESFDMTEANEAVVTAIKSLGTLVRTYRAILKTLSLKAGYNPDDMDSFISSMIASTIASECDL